MKVWIQLPFACETVPPEFASAATSRPAVMVPPLSTMAFELVAWRMLSVPPLLTVMLEVVVKLARASVAAGVDRGGAGVELVLSCYR